MPGAILLKGFKEFGIEPIGSLAGQGFAGALGDLYWFGSFGHKRHSLQSAPSLGKLCIRRHSCATPIDFNNDIDFYNDNAILCLYDVRVVRLGLCVRAANLMCVGLRVGFTRGNRRMFAPPGGGMIMQRINGFSKDRVINAPVDRRVDPDGATPARAVPAGLPAWITADLIAETLRAWQPYYAQLLTPEDAIGILLNVGNLFGVLSGVNKHETVCSISTGQQSGTGT